MLIARFFLLLCYLASLDQTLASVELQLFMQIPANPLEISYRIAQELYVGNNQTFWVIPSTMDLDSALFSYQCETPICNAECLGEGLRGSLSPNYTTNGTLFALDQTYQMLEGVKSQDTFQFPGSPSSFTLPNVTFMNAFYSHSKESFVPNSVNGSCTVGNGTLGFGRGLEGKMGPTLMSRFIEASNSDAALLFYNRLGNSFGQVGVTYRVAAYTPNLVYYPNLIDEWPLWTLPISDVQLGNFPLGANGIAVIDSASSYVRTPLVYSNLIAQQLSAIPQSTPEGVTYIIPNCDPSSLPNITISIAGDLYNMTGPMYTYLSGTSCLVLLLGSDPVYDNTPIWRLGAPFISVGITVLNFTSNNIGFFI